MSDAAAFIDVLRAALEKRTPEMLTHLERMVGINSFTANAPGVNRHGEQVAALFEPLGFQAELVPSFHPSYGSHLFLTRASSGSAVDARPLVLVSHLDTVYPEDEELRHDFVWRPSASEGRIYGPGTVDIKGGTALIWLMLAALRDVAPAVLESTSWFIALNASEEVIATDFAIRVKDRCPAGARAVLVFEGGPVDEDGLHIVTSRKGRAEYRIHASGRGAHAGSSHHTGANAIVALSHAAVKAASITDYTRELTLNVATVRGGTVLNRVPHDAELDLEVRAYDPEMMRLADETLLGLAGESQEVKGARIRVECVGRTAAWPATEHARAVFRHWHEAAGPLGMRVKPVSRGGLSDANYLCDLGPTLDGLGPAGANAHCSEYSVDGSKTPEYVEPSSFVPKALLNLLAIQRLLDSPH